MLQYIYPDAICLMRMHHLAIPQCNISAAFEPCTGTHTTVGMNIWVGDHTGDCLGYFLTNKVGRFESVKIPK